jgi:hypothetical protein
MTKRLTTYAGFWPDRLRQHTRLTTRALHYLGTALVTILLLWFLSVGTAILLPTAFIAGYGFAWTARAFVERNKSAMVAC